jgi:hypothetical protein
MNIYFSFNFGTETILIYCLLFFLTYLFTIYFDIFEINFKKINLYILLLINIFFLIIIQKYNEEESLLFGLINFLGSYFLLSILILFNENKNKLKKFISIVSFGFLSIFIGLIITIILNPII